MTTHYDADGITVHHGDALDVLRELPDASVDAVVTDPPYSLSFMSKAWDAHESPLAFRQWCERWAAECLRVLKPGGHMLAFGGTRTWHRLACAVEDAGFEVRDSIAWLYGSGFPKSLDVSKAIDKARTEDRAPVDAVRSWLNDRRIEAGYSHDAVNKHFGHASNGGGSSSAWMTNPTSRSLPTWAQWLELKRIFSFADDMDAEVKRLNHRKGTDGDNFKSRDVVGKGVSGIGTAFGDGEWASGAAEVHDITAPATDDARTWQGWGTALKPAFEPIVVARKPLAGTVAANVLRHGTGALNIAACRIGDGGQLKWAQPRDMGYHGGTDSGSTEATTNPAGRWPANVVLDPDSAAELDAMSGTLTSGILSPTNNVKASANDAMSGPNQADRVKGVFGGDSGGASRFFYTAKAASDERVRVDGIAHPTVKPLSLMRWLVRLVTPPGGTVLEPFAGSGTTVEACILEGFRCVAIERESDYLPLIMQRVHRRRDPVQAVKATGDDGGLFDLLDGGASA